MLYESSKCLMKNILRTVLLRRRFPLILLFLVGTIVSIMACRLTATVLSHVLVPPGPPDQNLQHFMKNRSLSYYLDNIHILIEPSTPCYHSDIPLVAVVATTSPRFDQRHAIRQTWAKHVPTYFLLGLEDGKIGEDMADIYIEAKEYSDMIVVDMNEHYQNLTLKTGLLMKWTSERCANSKFLLKIDDDVFLNPWKLKEVIKENEDKKLIGYKIKNSTVHRDQYTKWYLPRWLFGRDVIPEYLAGPAYILNTKYLKDILQKAKHISLINLEDVYFTYLVSNEGLNYELTHEKTLNPNKPMFICSYWGLTTAHSVGAEEMLSIWEGLNEIAKKNGSGFCIFPLFRPKG